MNYEIIVIGENCYDIFILGEVNRLCPEAPVPVINPIKKNVNLGMSGNVYENIRALNPNLNVLHIYQNSSNTESLMKKTRYIDITSGYILLRVDENDKIFERIDVDETITLIENQLPSLKAVVISDYNKGFLSENDIEQFTTFCCSKNIPIFLDTKKLLGSWSKDVSFVKINAKEYAYQTQLCSNPTLHCKNLIVTKGPEGSHYINDDIKIPTEQIEVRDVSGAGDTYLSAFVVHYIQNKEIISAMEYANKAASFAVSKQGVVIVKKEDIGNK